MMKKIIRRQVEEAATWGEGLHPILKRIYAARGISSDTFLERELSHLESYHHLKGIDQAVALLMSALASDARILIVGDFDADGATSSALSLRALRAFGATNVHYLVPNRFDFGYGLTPKLVEVAKEWRPDLIITVDNGIASIDGVAAAKEAGIKVLVTDHHLPGESLPDADAIVNPNQVGDGFVSKNLAGVGVVFYVMLALRAALKEKEWFKEKGLAIPNMANFLDIVALGTVADVVPLDQNNRILVYQGLKRIQAGLCCPGIRALLQVSERAPHSVTAQDVGFALGPRLNAAGRLDDMSLGIECLLTEDDAAARRMAQQLHALNQERRDIEADMKTQAFESMKALTFQKSDAIQHGLCFYNAEWHEGVIGILAARIKDKFHRPTIVFTKTKDGSLKGSARSVSGVHIRDVLADIDAHHPHVIDRFGGHAMAAGLSLQEAQFETFQTLFCDYMMTHIPKALLESVLASDGELPPEALNLHFAEVLRAAGPWGQAFPEPLFDGTFKLIHQRLLGGKHLKMVVSPLESDEMIDAIAFNVDSELWPNERCETVTLAYRLDINEYMGKRSPQLIVEQLG